MSDTVTNDSHPASPVERTAFVAAPLSVVQQREKALLEEMAQCQWQLLGILRRSASPDLLANAFTRGLLLSDPLWEEAIADAVWSFSEAREQVIAQYNLMVESDQ